MATNASTLLASMPNGWGVITLDGVEYIETPRVFTLPVTLTTSNQLVSNIPFTLPGVAPFLLKGLAREIISRDEAFRIGSEDRRFRFRIYGSQSAPWFFTSGLGITDDRVVDTTIFGSGQFPFPLIPPVPVPANGTLFIDIEDMGFQDPIQTWYFPYTVHLVFHGTYLIPTQDQGSRGGA